MSDPDPVADLDRRLAQARRDLLDEIQLPELDGVRVRAGGLRRRRRTAVGALALSVAALGAGVALWPSAADTPSPQPVAAPSQSAPGWTSGGLTVLALNGPVLELPGDLYDVQFGTAQFGYALSRQCDSAGCAVWFAATMDGGRTWRAGTDSYQAANGTALPRLQPVGSTGAVIVVGDQSHFARPGATVWTETTSANPPVVDAVPAGGQLWLPTPAAGCTPAPLRAWTADGSPVRLAHQPELQVCRVAAARTGDGAWWVSGRAGDRPALAVSRDEGATWSVYRLPAGSTGAWAQVVTRGPEVYASVVSAGEPRPGAVRVEAIYRSVEGGAFALYATDVGTVSGDVVPLLDGRLVAANGSLLVGDGRGAALHPAGTGLPAVGAIKQSAGVWVGSDVFLTGWVAVSIDGVTWQKINLH